jgi:uncharacterized protein (UPF0303 family)
VTSSGSTPAGVAVDRRRALSCVVCRHRAAEVDPATSGWLGADYAATGGPFPIRVRGVGVVAAATASGLSCQDDHDLIVEGIPAHLAEDGTR